MCEACGSNLLGRRGFLGLGAGAVAAAFAVGNHPAAADEGATTAMTPGQALAALKSGNERYVRSPQVCAVDLAHRRESVAGHQAPWAIVLTCSDSRVPPELIFGGLGVGELFVARNAGNLVDTGTLGTIEYGAAALGAPLVVVLGHTHCGAVKAACEIVLRNATFPGVIGTMVEPILPAALAARGEPGDFIDNTARRSAQRTALRLASESEVLAGRVRVGKLKIVAGMYDLDSGVAAFMS